MDTRYLDDLKPGDRFVSGGLTLNEAEIIDFAFRYDPQPFHLDANAAAESPYGGLIASGWHTGSIMMRLLVENYLSPVSSLGSPGLDELRWHRPVFPGDVLRVETELTSKKQSQSRPEMGSFQSVVRVFNQDGVMVMSMKSIGLIRVRGA